MQETLVVVGGPTRISSAPPTSLITISSDSPATAGTAAGQVSAAVTDWFRAAMGYSTRAVPVPSLRSNATNSWSGPTASIVHVKVNGTVPASQSTGPVGDTDASETLFNAAAGVLASTTIGSWTLSALVPLLAVSVTRWVPGVDHVMVGGV